VEELTEYAVAIHGRECLPTLLEALGKHNTWEGVIPGVFGVSDDEFEAGWQAYLADQYGSDTK
jgi:hypothetical protein